MIVGSCLCVVACEHDVALRSFVISCFVGDILNKSIMYAHHVGPWSTSSDGRDRTTHHKRTKQRGERDSWTWEENKDGKGPWRQAGEYRRPKEEIKAAKEEGDGRRRQVIDAATRGSPPQKIGGVRL